MTALITREKAIVYRAAGRRWLTKQAAYNALARKKINSRCDCERSEGSYPGYTCVYHAMDPDRFAKLKRRLSALIKRRILTKGPPNGS